MSRFQVTVSRCPDLVGGCEQDCRYPTTCGEAGECRRDDDEPVDNASMPLSSKEKQEAYRAKREMLGLTEVRGIFLPPALHAAIKAMAAKLLKEKAK